MSSFDKFIAGAFFLIALYLVFQSENVARVIGQFGASSEGIFKTLQGR